MVIDGVKWIGKKWKSKLKFEHNKRKKEVRFRLKRFYFTFYIFPVLKEKDKRNFVTNKSA